MTSTENRAPSIVFRTTAGKKVGLGHLRRCLTLAVAIRARGAASSIKFWIEGPAETATLATAAGFEAQTVGGQEPSATTELISSARADVLVVDSYEVDAATLSAWRKQLGSLIVIDDLADRFLDADLVLNTSPNAEALVYRTAADCTLVLGVSYALLGPTFRDLPRRRVPDKVSHVLVTLGGADPGGNTARAVMAVRKVIPEARIDVIVGPLFGAVPHLDELAERDPTRVFLHRGLRELSGQMTESEMAVSGGGQTLYEMAACGVPAIALCLAENQRGNLTGLATAGTLLSVDWSALERMMGQLATNRDRRQEMSEKGQTLVDGRGVDRVVDRVVALKRRRTVGNHVSV